MLGFFIALFLITIVASIVIVVARQSKADREAKASVDIPVYASVLEVKRGIYSTTALFQLADGSRHSLSFAGDLASNIMVGDHGMLTYHNTVFKSFERA